MNSAVTLDIVGTIGLRVSREVYRAHFWGVSRNELQGFRIKRIHDLIHPQWDHVLGSCWQEGGRTWVEGGGHRSSVVGAVSCCGFFLYSLYISSAVREPFTAVLPR